MRPVTREAFVERRLTSVRWSAIIAGALVAIAVWVALQMLGVGAGMAAIDTDDSGSLRGVGIGTGVWSIIAPLIALFVGGFVATRMGSVLDRGIAAIHGGVLWALTTVLGVVLMTWTINAMVGTAVRAGGHMMRSAGGAVAGIEGRDTMSALGIDENDLLAPVNQRLQEQGKPTVRADEVRAATRDVLRRGLREGRLDRPMVVDSLARNTALSRQDAEEVATRLEARFEEARGDVADMGDRAERTALTAADRTGKALLGAGIALLLGLAASIGGAMLGARRVEPRGPVVVATPIVPPGAPD